MTGGKNAKINSVENYFGRFQIASAGLMLNSATQLHGGPKMSPTDLAANAKTVSRIRVYLGVAG
jgi:hypothetical protein